MLQLVGEKLRNNSDGTNGGKERKRTETDGESERDRYHYISTAIVPRQYIHDFIHLDI